MRTVNKLWVVAVALIDPVGRVLLQQRPPGKSLAGLWEFPGGKIEPGEGPEDALIREVREELGIEIDPGDLMPGPFASAPLGDRHLVMLLYLCRRWQGTPYPHEATALGWYARGEMPVAEMPPADLPLIPLFEALI